MLDTIPTFLLDIITFLIFLLFFELGYLIGKRRDYNNVKKSDAVISPATASILGLFAFLIAFTFNLSAQKLDTRKQNVLLEANAIGTAHLRADLLQDPYKSRIKDLLREYTDVRLKIAAAMEDEAAEYLARSLEIQDLLWDEAVAASKEANDAATKLVIESLNEVFDMHSNRVAASIYNRIAGNIWLMLHSGSRNLGSKIANYYNNMYSGKFTCYHENGKLLEVGEVLMTDGVSPTVAYWFLFEDGVLVQWGQPEDWKDVKARYEIKYNPLIGVSY